MKYLVEFLGIVAWWFITGIIMILAGYNWFDGHGIGWFLNIIFACIFGKFCSDCYVDYKARKSIYSIYSDYKPTDVQMTRWVHECEYYGGGEFKYIGCEKEQKLINGVWIESSHTTSWPLVACNKTLTISERAGDASLIN